MNFYNQSPEEVAKHFNSDLKAGLSKSSIDEKKKQFGKNIIPVKTTDSYPKIFISQFKSPLIYILLAAAAIIFFLENKTDAFFISFVLLLNAFVGTYQEGKSGNLLDSLKKLMYTECVAIRDGKKKILNSTKLVPGDIILLQEGDQIPADARLIEAENLKVDEAHLSGESLPVKKSLEPQNNSGEKNEKSFYKQSNMVFSGTYVVSGVGKAIVTETGINTVMGKLKKMVEKIDTKIPLMVNIEKLAYVLLWIIAITCVFLFILGFLTGKDARSLLTTLTALFICVVPEGLPVIVTLVLAMGVSRMAKKKVLVKRLAAVEGLGQVNVIAVDKTGTVTKNEMTIKKVCFEGENVEPSGKDKLLGFAACLMSSAQVQGDNKRKGDPTDVALTLYGQSLGFKKSELEQKLSIFKDVPFSHEHKLKVIVLSGDFPDLSISKDKVQIFVLGAPEAVKKHSTVDTVEHDKCLNGLLEGGFRVLSLAKKEISLDEWKNFENKYLNDDNELLFKEGVSGLSFVSMYGMQDTLREEVVDTIKYVKDTGIHVIMMTGDHLDTAKNIATRSGILAEGDESIEGEQFEEGITPDKLETTTVYARFSPSEKLSVIQMFRDSGHIVAMTGDGVNDAPSLAAADIGVSMGKIGTEVAKEASDIVLLDDSFNSIVEAMEEGRHIFHTLKRVVLYFFSTNTAEILIVLISIAMGLPLPLLAIQILWLNLITDGFLDMALAMEPKTEQTLKKLAPRGGALLVDLKLVSRMMFMATPMAIGSLFMFIRHSSEGEVKARTFALITMAIFQLFNVWNCRSETKSVVGSGLFTNKYLFVVSILVFVLQLAMVYLHPMQVLFRTVALGLNDWIEILLIGSSIIFIEELRKLYVRRFMT